MPSGPRRTCQGSSPVYHTSTGSAKVEGPLQFVITPPKGLSQKTASQPQHDDALTEPFGGPVGLAAESPMRGVTPDDASARRPRFLLCSCHYQRMKQFLLAAFGIGLFLVMHLNQDASWTKVPFLGYLVAELAKALATGAILAVLGNGVFWTARAMRFRSSSSRASYRSSSMYENTASRARSEVISTGTEPNFYLVAFATWIAFVGATVIASSLVLNAQPFNGLQWEEPGWPTGEPQWLNMLRGICLLALPVLVGTSGLIVGWITTLANRQGEWVAVAIPVWISVFAAFFLPGLT